MYRGFIIVKSGLLISDRTDRIKSTPPGELFLLFRGCRYVKLRSDVSHHISKVCSGKDLSHQ
jgi:hypothetical protein